MAAKFRVVMVGCGGMSPSWLRGALAAKDARVVGLVDIHESAAQNRAAEFQLTEAVVGTDLRRVLRQTEANVVFNCTTPEAHLPVSVTALRHGCDVLSEKPLADSLPHARHILAAVVGAGRVFAVLQNYRYRGPADGLATFLRRRPLGALTALECDFHIGAHFGGFRDHMEHVLLCDMSIHHFDLARFLTGADPVAVYCREWNPKGSWYDHAAAAVAVFEMTNNIIFTYTASWCTEGMNTKWPGDWRIVGEKGCVTWRNGDEVKAQVRAGKTGFQRPQRDLAVPPSAPERAEGHATVIRDFFRCLRTDKTPPTVGTDNIKSLAMVFAAIESARSGKRVRV